MFDLVAPALGLDEFRVGLVVVEQDLLVFRKPEEDVFFRAFLTRGFVDLAAVARQQLFVGVEGFTADAVEPFVVARIEVSGFLQPTDDFEHAHHVAFFGGADEVVVGGAEQPPPIVVPLDHPVGQRNGLDLQLRRGLFDLLAVFVGAGQKTHPLAAQALPARHGVDHQGGVDMADVRIIVDVIDRRRDVVGLRHCAPKGRASGEPALR